MNIEKARLFVEMMYQSIIRYMQCRKSGPVYFRIDFSQGGIQSCKEVEMNEKEIVV